MDKVHKNVNLFFHLDRDRIKQETAHFGEKEEFLETTLRMSDSSP